jgi:hypothetical protein
LRNFSKCKIPPEELVVGDILVAEEGDIGRYLEWD